MHAHTSIELTHEPAPADAAEALIRAMTHRRFRAEYADDDRAVEAARAWAQRVLPRARLMQVRATSSGERCGEVWVIDEGEDLTLLSLSLDDHAVAPDLRELLLDLAGAEGRRRLMLGVAPGDPALEAFVVGREFESVAFQMRLDLDHTLAGEDTVELVPMDAATYDSYQARGAAEYAEAREKAGETREQAEAAARSQLAALLPAGQSTLDHHFFSGVVRGERVGTLWLGTERPMAFVYDVVVDEAQRRRGHGAGLMRAAALWSRDRGAHALGLNVFGYNHAAKDLYDRLGFHVVERFVAHTLTTSEPDA